jgi:BASS family bile acid:Na+ symporter
MLTPSTIKLLAVSSVFLLVVSIGLQARFGSVFRVFSDAQDRQKILGALAAMFLAVPLVAYLVVLLGVPGPTAGAVILAFSIAPIAPILPRKQLKFGGGTDWVTAFQVTGTLLSLALAPFYLAPFYLGHFSSAFSPEMGSAMPAMMKLLGQTVFVPLLIGMGLRQVLPELASRLVRPLGLAGTIILAGVSLLILVGMWPALVAAASTPALPASLVVAISGVILGHLFVRGDVSDKVPSAEAAVSRHPGVALTLAGAALGETQPELLVNLLLFVVVATVVLAAYQFMVGSEAR